MNKHTVKRHRFIHKDTLMVAWFEDHLWDHGIDPYNVLKYTVKYDMDEELFPIHVTYTNDIGNIDSMTVTIPTNMMFQYG